jgi:hypothetical protein
MIRDSKFEIWIFESAVLNLRRNCNTASNSEQTIQGCSRKDGSLSLIPIPKIKATCNASHGKNTRRTPKKALFSVLRWFFTWLQRGQIEPQVHSLNQLHLAGYDCIINPISESRFKTAPQSLGSVRLSTFAIWKMPISNPKSRISNLKSGIKRIPMPAESLPSLPQS